MKVMIADDHPLVRDALARTLKSLAEVEECIEVADYFELAERAAACAPDLVLVDLNMPGMEGADGVRRLRGMLPLARVIVVSAQDDAATVRAVLQADAAGFIPKSESRELVLQAIALVMSGGCYVPSRMVVEMRVGERPLGPGAGGASAADALTPRQRDVLALLLHGKPNKSIANELSLTEGTVKIHIAAILRALRARNRTEAVLRAQELGLGG